MSTESTGHAPKDKDEFTHVPKEVQDDISNAGGIEVIDRMQRICNHSIHQSGHSDDDVTDDKGSFDVDEIFEVAPKFSLGRIDEDAEDVSQVEARQSGLIPDSHPRVPVHTIVKMDMYLTAYDNFLSRWVPDLEFNYSDPGKISGGLGPLSNVVKLAFSDQYYTVRKAYLKVRPQIFEELCIEPGVDLTLSESVPEALVMLESDQYGPTEFNAQVDEVFSHLESRHLLDISGHRGTGYFLIWDDKEAGHLVALPTIGSFGHFLPEPGFSIVKEHGWAYFRDTEIIGFQVGHVRKVAVENAEDGNWEDWKLRGPIYLEVTEQQMSKEYSSCAYDDTMILRLQVDGSFFPGIVYGQVG